MIDQIEKEALPGESRPIGERRIRGTFGFGDFAKSFLQKLWAAPLTSSIKLLNHLQSNRKHMIISAIFALTLFVVETWFFRHSYNTVDGGGGYVALVLSFLPSHIFLHVFVVVASFVLAVGYLYAALTSTAGCRVVYFIIFSITVIAEYTSQATLGRFSDLADIRQFILVTNLEMQLTAVRMFFDWSSLLTCFVFAG